MATVFIPSLMRKLTGGQDRVQVPGATVRQVIDNLDQAYPGIKERLMENGRLKPTFTIAIDGDASRLGILEKVGENSEVHFLSAIAGG
ncbi:MAG: MoaD/ThiS family protein [Chloroflexi bacterium]|nr:MoaD/ThiS family protein [Chloroflexota bacterium]